MKERPGVAAVRHTIREPKTQEEIVYAITAELRGEMNGLSANDNGPVSYRISKREREGRLSKMQGLRVALMLALGLPLGAHEELDAFLEDFKTERLDAQNGVGR